MRVHIYKEAAGEVALLLEPTHGKGKVPVVLRHLKKKDVRGRAAQEIARMRGDDLPSPG